MRPIVPLTLLSLMTFGGFALAQVPRQSPLPQSTAAPPPSGEVQEIVLPGICTLSYKGRIYSQGPCEGVLINHRIAEVSGRMSDDALTFRAVINEDDQTGVLLGAEVFVLGDGPYEHSPAGGRYLWATGYALDAVFSVEE